MIYNVFVNRSVPAGPDGELFWFRLLNWLHVPLNGAPVWSHNGAGVQVGGGFTVTQSGAMQGYPSVRTAVAGQVVDFSVSTNFAQHDVNLIRQTGPGTGQVVQTLSAVPGRFQMLQANYRQNGCGWQTSFSITVNPAWRSGFYVVRLIGPRGLTHDMPLVISPPAPIAKIAVVLPFNTNNAYNSWGGHNQYTWGELGIQRKVALLTADRQPEPGSAGTGGRPLLQRPVPVALAG